MSSLDPFQPTTRYDILLAIRHFNESCTNPRDKIDIPSQTIRDYDLARMDELQEQEDLLRAASNPLRDAAVSAKKHVDAILKIRDEQAKEDFPWPGAKDAMLQLYHKIESLQKQLKEKGKQNRSRRPGGSSSTQKPMKKPPLPKVRLPPQTSYASAGPSSCKNAPQSSTSSAGPSSRKDAPKSSYSVSASSSCPKKYPSSSKSFSRSNRPRTSSSSSASSSRSQQSASASGFSSRSATPQTQSPGRPRTAEEERRKAKAKKAAREAYEKGLRLASEVRKM